MSGGIRRAWRIVKPRYVGTAFDGEGARLYGGRWNSPGVALVYTAAHLSLAALEMLVHLPAEDLLQLYVCVPVEFPADLVEVLASLPAGWSTDPVPLGVRQAGDRWAREARSAVLEVPSAVVPQEQNYLLNPRHQDFARVSIGEPQAFRFDPRL